MDAEESKPCGNPGCQRRIYRKGMTPSQYERRRTCGQYCANQRSKSGGLGLNGEPSDKEKAAMAERARECQLRVRDVVMTEADLR